MAKPNIHVAIALIFHQKQVLVGWRQANQHQGNQHEFPGGKVEKGETPLLACRREVQEEVGVDIERWCVFDLIRHEYDDVIVHLHLFHAALEHAQLADIKQPWTWYRREHLTGLNFPKANDRIIKRLHWPHYLKISAQLNDLKELAADHLLYWYSACSKDEVVEVAQWSIERLSKLVIDHALWKKLGELQQNSVAAVYLSALELAALQANQLKQGICYIAECHDLASMQHAAQIGCDAILLSPVQPTESHAGQLALGWQQFERLATAVDIPVFARGGLSHDDLAQAQCYGGYGIAGLAAF